MQNKTYLTARTLAEIYLDLKSIVVTNGYGPEIDWQDTRDLNTISESEFLQESAWVILCSGMKESIIRNIFGEISIAFINWKSSNSISENAESCRLNALKVFNSPLKIAAILSLCNKIDTSGFKSTKRLIKTQGIDFLKEFDFIGPITCYHLAKNIGLDVVKPDRHLVRIAKECKVSNPHRLCDLIAQITGDRISVIDVVLWRYATIHKDYLSKFKKFN